MTETETHDAEVADLARFLEEALALELGFGVGDAIANAAGRFSPAQRARSLRNLASSCAHFAIGAVMLVGAVWVLNSARVIPVFVVIVGIAAIGFSWLSNLRRLVDAVARVINVRPLSTVGRLDNDPTNVDKLILRVDERPLKIARAAIDESGLSLADLRSWRFEVYLVPWTRAVVAVRPLPPNEKLVQKDRAGERRA